MSLQLHLRVGSISCQHLGTNAENDIVKGWRRGSDSLL